MHTLEITCEQKKRGGQYSESKIRALQRQRHSSCFDTQADNVQGQKGGRNQRQRGGRSTLPEDERRLNMII